MTYPKKARLFRSNDANHGENGPWSAKAQCQWTKHAQQKVRSKTDQLCPSDRFDIIEEFHSHNPMSSILEADFLSFAIRFERNGRCHQCHEGIQISCAELWDRSNMDPMWDSFSGTGCGTCGTYRRKKVGRTGAKRPCHFGSQMNMWTLSVSQFHGKYVRLRKKTGRSLLKTNKMKKETERNEWVWGKR